MTRENDSVHREYPSRLCGGVVWSSVSDAGQVLRILPDGCMDLIWDGAYVMVAGPDTHSQLFQTVSGRTMTGLRLAPGQGPLVIGVPANELVNTRVSIDAVWSPARVRQITDLLSESHEVAETLEDIASEGLAGSEADSRLMAQVATLAGSGHTSSAIAQQVGLSPRQLQRRSSAAFGYGTKMLTRILRLQRAVRMSYDGVSKAEVAARNGYADQPHLAREVKELAGVSLGTLIS